MSRWAIRSRGDRFLAYGTLGWVLEVAFTGLHDFKRYRDPRLPARTSLWMLPIYGLLQPLLEPAHDAMRGRVPAPVRAAAYAAGIFGIEYATGKLLRSALGQAPWDYSDARWNVHGLIRLDYAPYWAVVGLGAERVHDLLTGREADR